MLGVQWDEVIKSEAVLTSTPSIEQTFFPTDIQSYE